MTVNVDTGPVPDSNGDLSPVTRPRDSEQVAASDGAMAQLSASDYPIELVFGLVGPTGVDLEEVATALSAQLRAVEYVPNEIRLSKVLLQREGRTEGSFDYFDRIDTLIRSGNELCRRANRKDMVARLGITEIRRTRYRYSGNENEPAPKVRVAYIVRSFKRQEEVELYRNTYGKAFNLISVYAPREARLRALESKIRAKKEGGEVRTPQELASRLAERDHKELGNHFGQRVGKTFPLADFFLSVAPRAELEKQLGRFIRLILGDPYLSPTRDEQGMFFAQAAALRSLDLSRQVGAAIFTNDGDILSTGCNEVPKFGGGLYWGDDDGVRRDVEMGFDANIRIKTELVEDAIQTLRDNGWIPPLQAPHEVNPISSGLPPSDHELAEEMLFGEKPYFEGTKLFDVIEFGRAVHAEMDAISQAARHGVPLQNSRLFCTTFPCHICARHIVAAGISEVMFIEPYEKSRTAQLYPDSISIEPGEPSKSKANFRAFVGVAPRRYIDLFQMMSERKNKNGTIRAQAAGELRPRFKRFVFSYIQAEILFETEYAELLKKQENTS